MSIKRIITVLAVLLWVTMSPLAVASENPAFLSVADLHFDPFTICTNATPCPLIQELARAPASQWGTILAAEDTHAPRYLQDTNYALLQSALNALQATAQAKHVQFVVVLGDFLAHSYQDKYQDFAADKSQASYQAFVKKTLQYLTLELQKRFPNTNVYMALGNNDSYNGDYGYDTHDGFFHETGMLWSTLLTNRVNQMQMSWMFSNKGYYEITLPMQRNLRLIVLNSNLFSPKSTAPSSVAADELTWFESQLKLARSLHQKVLIAMHIPAGIDVYASLHQQPFALVNMWQADYTAQFAHDLKDYAPNIMGILTAHCHNDSSQLLENQIPVSGVQSISPVNGNNPGFKVFSYNPTTLQLIDFETYYAPLNTLQWQLEYDFNSTYQPNCTACQLAQGIATLPSTGALADTYERYYSTLQSSNPIQNTYNPFYWCQTKTISAADFQTCITQNKE